MAVLAVNALGVLSFKMDGNQNSAQKDDSMVRHTAPKLRLTNANMALTPHAYTLYVSSSYALVRLSNTSQ
jgi:hypothetical protein